MLSESFTRDWNSAFKHTWETIKSESIKQRVKSHLSWRDSSTPAFEKALQRVCNSTNSTASIKPDCVNSNLSSFFLLCASKVTLNIISVKLIYLLNKKKLLPVIFKLCLKKPQLHFSCSQGWNMKWLFYQNQTNTLSFHRRRARVGRSSRHRQRGRACTWARGLGSLQPAELWSAQNVGHLATLGH